MSAEQAFRYVFVGGLHRSGTTLLGRCIAEHPDVSGFEGTDVSQDEGQHLQTVIPPASRHGGAGRFVFRRASHLTETSPLASVESRRRLEQQWNPHWDLSRRVLVEKSPPNLVRFRLLQTLFPDSLCIAVVRHPIPVACATQKWSRTSISSLVRHWVRAHVIFSDDRPHLHNVLVVYYEDFIQDPQRTLDRIYARLGLPAHEIALGVRADGNEWYFAHWELAVRSVERLRRRLLIARYERAVRRFGYSLRDLRSLDHPLA